MHQSNSCSSRVYDSASMIASIIISDIRDFSRLHVPNSRSICASDKTPSYVMLYAKYSREVR